MTPLEGLRAEIDTRVAESHPEVIVAALERLMNEVDEAQAEIHSGACSYSVNFQRYRTLRSKFTYFNRLLEDQYGYSQWIQPPHSLYERITATSNALSDLRMKRYTNVCGKCSACKTRRRVWPEHTNFTSVVKPSYGRADAAVAFA